MYNMCTKQANLLTHLLKAASVGQRGQMLHAFSPPRVGTPVLKCILNDPWHCWLTVCGFCGFMCR